MAVFLHPYELTMFFSTDVAGWSEKLLLKSTTTAAALTDSALILQYRRRVLPFNADIVYARVTDLKGESRLAAAVLDTFPVPGDYGYTTTGPSPAPPSVAEAEPDEGVFGVNATRDALLVRMESLEWEWSIRYLHGVPDPILSNDKTIGTIAAATVLPSPFVQYNADDWYTRMSQYLFVIKTNANILRYRSGGSIEGFLVNRITIRKAGGHKVGRPFGGSRGRAIPR